MTDLDQLDDLSLTHDTRFPLHDSNQGFRLLSHCSCSMILGTARRAGIQEIYAMRRTGEQNAAAGTIRRKLHALQELHDGNYAHCRNYLQELHDGNCTHCRNYTPRTYAPRELYGENCTQPEVSV